jgi:tryptophan-rich sensory protein
MFDFSLIISLLISLGSGVISGFLTREETSVFFDTIVKAPLTPPAFVFPIVWTALYALMGYSAWLVWKGKCNEKRISLFIYSLQLAFVFLWPIIFFVYKQFEISFFWIILLWLMIITMVILFYSCERKAGLLQIPYLIWVTFASYLTFAICVLN